MSETVQIILGLIFLLGVYVLTRMGVVWRMRRACTFIIQDLERRGATDTASAAHLPYAKTDLFRIGMRDYKPKALESLLHSGVVGRTENGRYYLVQRPAHSNPRPDPGQV